MASGGGRTSCTYPEAGTGSRAKPAGTPRRMASAIRCPPLSYSNQRVRKASLGGRRTGSGPCLQGPRRLQAHVHPPAVAFHAVTEGLTTQNETGVCCRRNAVEWRLRGQVC